MANLTEYPRFNDGDVLILAPEGTTWKLHSSHLINASIHFRQLLDETPAVHLTKKQKTEGKTVRWRIRMNVEPLRRELVDFRVVDSNTKNQLILPENVNGLGIDHPYLKIYDNFFKCIYNMDPRLNDKSQMSLVGDCINLLDAAEAIDSVQTVRRFIESALLRLGNALYETIRGRLETWAELGFRLQSPAIFREAMVHIIGAWNVPGAIDRHKITRLACSAQIFDLVSTTVDALVVRKQEIDQGLLAYYPDAMLHPVTNGQKPTRTIYANDIYIWQALVLFREWVAREMINERTWQSADGGFEFYKKLYQGNDKYLAREDVDEFLKKFAMSQKGRDCLEAQLYRIKEHVRDVVSELFVCQAQGVTDALQFDYFTCGTFTDKQLPWFVRTGEILSDVNSDGTATSEGYQEGSEEQFEEELEQEPEEEVKEEV